MTRIHNMSILTTLLKDPKLYWVQKQLDKAGIKNTRRGEPDDFVQFLYVDETRLKEARDMLTPEFWAKPDEDFEDQQ